MKNKNEINLETLKKLSKLARLEVDENTSNDLIRDLNKILGFINQLNEVDTKNIEPLNSVTSNKMPLREDKVKDGNINEEILQNAPEKTNDYFVVPKVIE